jgi:head-tail adaptor
VTIQQPGADTVSALGEATTPWVAAGSFWAHRYVKAAVEDLTQQVETAVTTTRFHLRNPRSLSINPEMRLIWNENIYNIREVIPTGPADSELLLICTEVLDG